VVAVNRTCTHAVTDPEGNPATAVDFGLPSTKKKIIIPIWSNNGLSIAVLNGIMRPTYIRQSEEKIGEWW